MIGIRYEPTAVDGRVAVAAARVLANGQSLGIVSQLADGSGWVAVTEGGRHLPGLHRRRSDGGDALVEWSGILDR